MVATADLTSSVLNVQSSTSVVASRSSAVDRIVQGGLLGLAGVVLFVVGEAGVLSNTYSLALELAGVVFAGGGLSIAGSAVRHLARFGRTRATLIVGGVAGFGVSLLLNGLSVLGGSGAGISWLERLNFLTAVSAMGFATFIVLLGLGALLRLMVVGPDEGENRAEPNFES